jgi:hypothetical protein
MTWTTFRWNSFGLGLRRLRGAEMNRVVPHLVSASILLLLALLTLSCGGGTMDPPRMLKAISVTPEVAQAPNGQTQVQFVATGTFTEPPITVTPLAVSWNFANIPLIACSTNNCAQITSQGVAMCGNLAPGSWTITASAPSDPKAPLNDFSVPRVSATAALACQQ